MSEAASPIHKILWVDSNPTTLSLAQETCASLAVQIVAASSLHFAFNQLRSDAFAAVVVDQEFLEHGGWALLDQSAELFTATVRLLVVKHPTDALIREAINRSAISQFINKPYDGEQLRTALSEAIRQHGVYSTREGLLEEIKLQNRQLRDLTNNLEQLVEQRTQIIEQSKAQAEHTSAHRRELVRFLSQLTAVNSLEDLLILIRQELRLFHHVNSPILASYDAQFKPIVLAFRSSQVIVKRMPIAVPESGTIRINEAQDQYALANIFGRPFGRIIAIPFSGKVDQTTAWSTLYLEHSLSEHELDGFLDFWSQRLEPLNVALDRLLLSDQLQAISSQWESTFDGIYDPIAIVDSRFRLVRANRAFAALSAKAPCHQVFSGREHPCTSCPTLTAVVTTRPQMAQVRCGGQMFSVYSYPIQDSPEGLTSYTINHYVDVTDARKLYGRMIQSEKMAAIGSLAGNIAHELNNPLSGIRSLAQILIKERAGTETMQSDLQEVEKAAERCATIIRNLLEFSQGGDKKAHLISVNDVVAKTLPLLKTAMRFHQSQVSLSEEPLTVRAEPHLLQQTVFNLVNNACQAMHKPGTMSLRTAIIERKWAEIVVRDTGPGIASENLKQIFEPFFTTKDEGQGTGLGLSVSRQIVEQFGGHIEVQSIWGEGAEFRILLPLAEEAR